MRIIFFFIILHLTNFINRNCEGYTTRLCKTLLSKLKNSKWVFKLLLSPQCHSWPESICFRNEYFAEQFHSDNECPPKPPNVWDPFWQEWRGIWKRETNRSPKSRQRREVFAPAETLPVWKGKGRWWCTWKSGLYLYLQIPRLR